MKSVGQILKEARLKQKKTLEEINKITKIPIKNLKALEKNNFASLPPATFVKGFIQKYAQVLGLSHPELLAIYRRDFKKKEKVNIIPPEVDPKKVKQSFFWTPKTSLVLTIGSLLIIFFIYLGLQIKNFFTFPRLKLESPPENGSVKQEWLEIKGKTKPEVSVYVNDQLINIDEEGNFSYQLKLIPGENNIEVKAINRHHKETLINRQITLVDKDN